MEVASPNLISEKHLFRSTLQRQSVTNNLMYHRRHPLRSHEQDSVTKTYSRFLTGAKTGEDGLTYKESTFSARPSSIWTTIEKRPAPWDLVVTDDRADGTGAHSLMYLVRKVINQSLDTLSLDALHLTPYDPWGFWIWTDALATYHPPLPLPSPLTQAGRKTPSQHGRSSPPPTRARNSAAAPTTSPHPRGYRY